MAYDGTSYNGDIICRNFDKKNNIMNPPSEQGWFFYKLYGYCFDDIDELINQMIFDFSPLRCHETLLEAYGKDCRIDRDPNWSDDEFRAIICLNWYETILLAGMEYVFNNLQIVGVTPETGDIIIETYYQGFRASNQHITNELTSDKNTLNHTLNLTTGNDLVIYVPNGVNTPLIEFMIDYIPFNFEMIMYDG